MTQLAKNYQTPELSTTDGLEDLFADATQCEASCIADASHCEYTILEAANTLKVSPSTIYRRIKSGKYQTITTNDGVIKVLLPRNALQKDVDASQCVADDSQCVAIDSQCVADANHASTDVATLTKGLLEMAQKLEAATYRVGWLESQLQERDKEIKMLTDSQHHQNWWARFASWFFRVQ